MSLAKFKADPEKSENGIRIDLGKNPDDGAGHYYLQIRRANNAQHQAKLIALMKGQGSRHAQMLSALTNGASDDVSDEFAAAMRKAAAYHILVDWSLRDDAGDFVEPGEMLEYSPCRALELFNHKAYADLYEFVMGVANDAEMFREAEIEADAGN